MAPARRQQHASGSVPTSQRRHSSGAEAARSSARHSANATQTMRQQARRASLVARARQAAPPVMQSGKVVGATGRPVFQAIVVLSLLLEVAIVGASSATSAPAHKVTPSKLFPTAPDSTSSGRQQAASGAATEPSALVASSSAPSSAAQQAPLSATSTQPTSTSTPANRFSLQQHDLSASPSSLSFASEAPAASQQQVSSHLSCLVGAECKLDFA